MLKSIEMLREICDCCQSHEPLSQNQCDWLGRSLEDFLTQRCTSLREAFGLLAPQGGIPWWREEGMRTRDQALRTLAEIFCEGYSVSARARFIGTLARRYAASSWRFDRERSEMPAYYTGTPRQFLWEAFKSGAPMPISERRLRSLLAE